MLVVRTLWGALEHPEGTSNISDILREYHKFLFQNYVALDFSSTSKDVFDIDRFSSRKWVSAMCCARNL